MSRPRRLLLLGLVVVVVLATAVTALSTRRSRPVHATPAATRPAGPVLLVPGYGGSTASLQVLAARLRSAGRSAQVVPLPSGGTGDLRVAARALGAAAERALAGGAASVDVVGYSAGGVVAHLWAAGGGARTARRVVTLGSPNHGTTVASLALALAPDACAQACRQLVPDSPLLKGLGDSAPPGPSWLSVWTDADQTVMPPESARLSGARNLVVQDLCPGVLVSHGELPQAPVVVAVVLAALSGPQLRVPARCPSP